MVQFAQFSGSPFIGLWFSFHEPCGSEMQAKTTYKEKGYFVGSGNKVVVQKRLKLAGMRWNTESAQYLLTLRAKFSSGRWISDVEASIAKLFSITPEVLKIPKK